MIGTRFWVTNCSNMTDRALVQLFRVKRKYSEKIALVVGLSDRPRTSRNQNAINYILSAAILLPG